MCRQLGICIQHVHAISFYVLDTIKESISTNPGMVHVKILLRCFTKTCLRYCRDEIKPIYRVFLVVNSLNFFYELKHKYCIFCCML